MGNGGSFFRRALAWQLLGMFVTFGLGAAYGRGLQLALWLFAFGVCGVLWMVRTALETQPDFEARFNEFNGGVGPSSRIVSPPASHADAQRVFVCNCPLCGEVRSYPLEPFAPDTAASQLQAGGDCCCGALVSVIVSPPLEGSARG